MTNFLWISVTIVGLKVPSKYNIQIVPLLLELLVLIYVISIAAAFVLKLLFLISRLFSTDNGPYEPTETESSQNDLLHQRQADINNDFLKESSINSEQYLLSTSFSNGDHFTGDTNMAGYFLSHPQNCGDVLTDRRLQTKEHENGISRSLRVMQPQESHIRTLQSEYHQGPNMLQTEDRQGPHRKMLQTESHQVQPTRPLLSEDLQHQRPYRNMLQTDSRQEQPARLLPTEALQHQGPKQKIMPTKTLLERRAEVKRAASGAGRINRFSSSQGNIQQSKGEINNMGDHHGLHTNVLQTEIYQGQPSRSLQTEDLHHQRPLQIVTPTKTLLERRAEAKIAASGTGGINRLYSKSVGNIQQSKGDTNNNSNKISDANTEVNNESSQGRSQPPAQNSVCTTRSGHIYKRF
ncbi:hypothetical protein JTE90_010134 [Oedothorax gibbosus]|uniref:Uncharacterized protein n=1 Tax=Oedothorax gibbosus TaxID=931172 RepID=A0AAV6UHU6_9ARAC|nr:hypothetical protein JTE90_010134 [Oedothorax gibbosus]